MKNQIQLITYANRLGDNGLKGIHKLLKNEFKDAFGGVHLLPFYFPIDGADAGYDPIDHTRVDERIGSWEDVSKIGADFDVLGDIIVNHVSAQSKEFKDVEEKGVDSPFFDLFLTKEKVFPKGASVEDIEAIYRPRPSTPFTKKTIANGEIINLWTTFTSNQLDIDVLHPLGENYLNSILEKFSQAGIKMIRLDAAGYAIKKAGTSCFMLPETYEFLDKLAGKAKHLGMEVLVEIHSYYREQIKIAQKVDFVYDFALPPLVLHSIRSKRFTELKNWLEISPRNCVTVLDTHDGIGVIDVTGSNGQPGLLTDEDVDLLVQSIHKNANGQSLEATGEAASNLDLYQVNCTFYDALGKNDKDYLIARAIQFFCPGIPQVYYMGLLAGENDMELLRKTKVGRDINRHYYGDEEIKGGLERDVVKSMIKIMKFRNNHPSFNGDFIIEKSDSDVLILTWVNGEFNSTLIVDFEEDLFRINYSDSKGTSMFEPF
ncbi:sucrose phosphorylase [uncultured Cyclobacterium sp.]|uniref:sucrose phosphorylase n=1 Tax=uncultured Cyclobacterium sp. TaxID=453820 RepID=UPI0030EED2EB